MNGSRFFETNRTYGSLDKNKKDLGLVMLDRLKTFKEYVALQLLG